MKKILCFGNVTEKYKNAIERAMGECKNIAGRESAPENDELNGAPGDFILLKCDIHSDDFLRHIIAINKKLYAGEKFYLTHCAVCFNKTGNRAPFILTDAACVPMPDESQLTHIVQNAVKLFGQIFGAERAPFISLISAGGDTNTKIAPMLHEWFAAHANEFPANTLRIEQLDVALDQNIRAEKHLAGESADIIVVDNINTGNAIFKSLSVLSDNWYPVCFIMGAKNTVLLNSRGATADVLTKNILLATKG